MIESLLYERCLNNGSDSNFNEYATVLRRTLLRLFYKREMMKDSSLSNEQFFFVPDPSRPPSNWTQIRFSEVRDLSQIRDIGTMPDIKERAETKMKQEKESTLRKRVATAKSMMQKHGLLERGWTFGIDKAKTRMGACYSDLKKITFSIYLVLHCKEEEFLNVVLHEIAHALAGHSAGHGPMWKSVAQSIGCDGQRCCYNKEFNDAVKALKTQFVCACGSTKILQYKKPRNSMCCFCHSNLFPMNR